MHGVMRYCFKFNLEKFEENIPLSMFPHLFSVIEEQDEEEEEGFDDII